MGSMENRPDNYNYGDNGRTVEAVLQSVTHDLKRLHQGLITQLAQEVNQLQAEKARLTSDVQKLQTQHHQLQLQNSQALSQQQIAQQQLWAKQLALALSNHLQRLLIQQISQTIKSSQTNGTPLSMTGDSQAHSENAHRLLASLDTTFSATFKSLQQELNSYQSSLSQQLNRMHTLEQQGEAVLEALVQRLREQLQLEAEKQSQLSQSDVYKTIGSTSEASSAPNQETVSQTSSLQAEPPHARQVNSSKVPASSTPLAVPGMPPPQKAVKKELPTFWVGLCLVLLSTVALSTHNVVVRIIGRASSILGSPPFGGFINITVLGNSLLILWLRMLVVLPLMVVVAMILYPAVWRDLKKFFTCGDRRPIFNVVGSGAFLFLSQVLIYIAIGQIGAGPAVTILFMYPVITVPLAWLLFGDRPTPLRWGVMAAILGGVILTAQPGIAASGSGWSLGGVAIAVGSGIAFALYLIFMQLGFKKLHPVPVSLVQFFTIFVLSAVILIALGPNLGVQVMAEQRTGFVLGGILLGVLTLIGYLSNNFGVRFMGAGLASIVASIGPVMTALLAWIFIQNRLEGIQWLGILLVTLGVGALSFERMKLQGRKT